jgi:type II secretory pathway component PulJ
MSGSHLRTSIRVRSFTLVELMAGVLGFSILALLLVQILISVQRTWTDVRWSLDVWDSGRAALAQVEHDLRGLVVSHMTGEQIGIDVEGIGARDVAFVVREVMPCGSMSTLFEVGYGLVGDELYRWQTGDADGEAWDFLNESPEVWAADSSWGASGLLVDGVEAFSVTFHMLAADGSLTAYDPDVHGHARPEVASVSLRMLPPGWLGAPESRRKQQRLILSTQVDLGRHR